MWYFQRIFSPPKAITTLQIKRHGRDAHKYLYIKTLVKPKDFAHNRLVLVKDFSPLKYDFMQNVQNCKIK